MSICQIIRESTGEILVPDLELGNTWLTRFRGLMFRKRISPGKAILLVPCSSVHTHWLRFSIDIIMLDKHGVVQAIHRDVKPWRMVVAPKTTFAVLEWTAGAFDIDKGERLRVASRNPGQKKKPVHLGYLYREL